MQNGKITYFLVIFQAVLMDNKLDQQRQSLLTKLANYTPIATGESYPKSGGIERLGHIAPEHQCKYECADGNVSSTRANAGTQVRFTDKTETGSKAIKEMEAQDGKFPFFHLIASEDADNEGDEIDDEHEMDGDYDDERLEGDPDVDDGAGEGDEEEEGEGHGAEGEDEEDYENEEENEDDDYGFNFLASSERKPGATKLKEKKGPGKIGRKPHHVLKAGLKMKHFIFPLLLAYKLKFFTIIPVLVGSLVLLVGTMSMAGFFFALFSVALGLQSNSHHH